MVFFILLFILFLYLTKKAIEVVIKAKQQIPELPIEIPKISTPEIPKLPIDQVTGIGTKIIGQLNEYLEKRNIKNYAQDNISAGTAVLYDHKYED
jgi:DNA polymerase/3'-5' exonuclease PolX